MDGANDAQRLRAHATMCLAVARSTTTFPERTAVACEGILAALLAIDSRMRRRKRAR